MFDLVGFLVSGVCYVGSFVLPVVVIVFGVFGVLVGYCCCLLIVGCCDLLVVWLCSVLVGWLFCVGLGLCWFSLCRLAGFDFDFAVVVWGLVCCFGLLGFGIVACCVLFASCFWVGLCDCCNCLRFISRLS